MKRPNDAIGEAPVIFFNNLLAVFDRARARPNRLVEKFYQLGTEKLRVCILGDVLAEKMLRALNHLAVPETSHPALTVFMWDDAFTHTRMPPPPWNWNEARLPRGEILGFNTERIYTAYDEGADVLHVFDREARTAVYWTRDANRLPSYEVSAPLRTILHWFTKTLPQQEFQLVHGGAVGTRAGGALLAGKGGSGKSTSVLACLESGLLYAADDYCLVTADPQPHVYSIYSSAKLNADSVARLPHLSSAIANPQDTAHEKAVLFLEEEWHQKLIPGFPLVAILLPRIRAQHDTTLVPVASVEGVRALCLSTLIQLPRADAVSAQRIQRLVSALPCYTLELGTDLKQIPQRISELIAQRASDPVAQYVDAANALRHNESAQGAVL